ncbi:hypothetical protein CKO12_05290 [Chromatium okenii]|uniref:O-antigen ligase family protein n=1 Tax=Chromatium okenii TaxID=61644 RepID=UPI001906C788|nr:O-antigen ligase family protein [Chromatium okenii]MBK1641296.1 hypothetical protein [Chromatium okenii]
MRHHIPQSRHNERSHRALVLHLWRNHWQLLPLLITVGIVPLLVLLHITPIPTAYQPFWITEQVFDFFSYYKAQLIIVCAAVLLLNILFLYVRKQLPPQPIPYVIPLLSYALLLICSALLSAHSSIALHGFFERYEGMWVLLSYLILLLASAVLITTVRQVWLVVQVWAIALAIMAGIGVSQFIGFDPFQTESGRLLIIPQRYESLAAYLEFHFPPHWVYATLYNPNNVAHMMALALPITTTAILCAPTKRSRFSFALLTGLLLIVLAGTHARGGWVAILSAALLVLMIVFQPAIRRYWRQIKQFALVFVVMGVFWLAWNLNHHQVFTAHNPQLNQTSISFHETFLETLIRHYGTLGSGRMYIWLRSLEQMDDTLLIGRGPDTFALYFPNQDEYKRFFNQPEAFIDKPHNSYLQTWLNLGGGATLALFVLLFTHAKRTFLLLTTAPHNTDLYPLSLGLYASWVAYLIAAVFYDSVVSVAPIFWIIFGLSVAVNQLLKMTMQATS